jgi:hypothetical protein
VKEKPTRRACIHRGRGDRPEPCRSPVSATPAGSPDHTRPARQRPTRAAQDQAEHRQRKRKGIVRCVYVPISELVLLAMMDRGLSEMEACDPKAIGRDAATVLHQWARRWFAEKR